MGIAAPRTVGEIESFITMLRSACSDQAVYQRLERLLSLPDARRQAVVRAWVSDLLIAGAPQDFIQAVGCLVDDQVAEKAYEVIYRCQTGGRSQEPPVAAARKFKPWLIGGAAACGLALLALVVFGWPQPKCVEVGPSHTVRPRSAAIAAYETVWWNATRPALVELCGSLPSSANGSYGFILYVDSAGRVVRADVTGERTDALAFRVKRELASLRLPAFTPEQKAEKANLGMRGHLQVTDGRCVLQRT